MSRRDGNESPDVDRRSTLYTMETSVGATRGRPVWQEIAGMPALPADRRTQQRCPQQYRLRGLHYRVGRLRVARTRCLFVATATAGRVGIRVRADRGGVVHHPVPSSF